MKTGRSDLSILIKGVAIAMVCALCSGNLNAEESDTVLRAAENRLLDRLWQMPFYLTTTRPRRPETTAPSGYGPWREQIVATVFWVGESASLHNPVPNNTSAWDHAWQANLAGSMIRDDGRFLSDKVPAKPNPFCRAAIRRSDRRFDTAVAGTLIPWWIQ